MLRIELLCGLARSSPDNFSGRTILGNDVARVFSYGIASLFAALLSSSHDEKQLRDFTDCCEDQDDLRKQIALAGLHDSPSGIEHYIDLKQACRRS